MLKEEANICEIIVDSNLENKLTFDGFALGIKLEK
jgi:hypothetical protein